MSAKSEEGEDGDVARCDLDANPVRAKLTNEQMRTEPISSRRGFLSRLLLAGAGLAGSMHSNVASAYDSGNNDSDYNHSVYKDGHARGDGEGDRTIYTADSKRDTDYQSSTRGRIGEFLNHDGKLAIPGRRVDRD